MTNWLHCPHCDWYVRADYHTQERCLQLAVLGRQLLCQDDALVHRQPVPQAFYDAFNEPSQGRSEKPGLFISVQVALAVAFILAMAGCYLLLLGVRGTCRALAGLLRFIGKWGER